MPIWLCMKFWVVKTIYVDICGGHHGRTLWEEIIIFWVDWEGQRGYGELIPSRRCSRRGRRDWGAGEYWCPSCSSRGRKWPCADVWFMLLNNSKERRLILGWVIFFLVISLFLFLSSPSFSVLHKCFSQQWKSLFDKVGFLLFLLTVSVCFRFLCCNSVHVQAMPCLLIR